MMNIHAKVGMPKEGGFTLIEVMVALAIFAAGILAVMGMFVSGIQQNTQGKMMTEASALAQSQLDYLAFGVRYEHLGEYAGTETNLKSDGTVAAGEKGPYERETEITDVAGTDLKKIVVTVSWSSTEGQKGELHRRQVKLKTLKGMDR